MISGNEIVRIREHLEKAQNPVFLYDNDADGFCSFILLRRWLGRGKGVAVRTHPNVDEGYARRVSELGGDCVFVLDRPFLGIDFVRKIEELQLPIIWIDHHQVQCEDYSYPLLEKFEGNVPITAIAYQIAQKEDMWIAMMGCISDHYLGDFKDDFAKVYGDLWSKNVKMPFDAYYKTEIGRLARALGFGLKDSITNVVKLQSFMISCKTPRDMINELETSSTFAHKYREMKERYDSLLAEARSTEHGKLVFFRYGGGTSMSSDLANELCYLNPDKYVIVAYTNGTISNLSIRGKNVSAMLNKIIGDFEGASGGGHADAVGARVRTSDLELFKKKFESLIDL